MASNLPKGFQKHCLLTDEHDCPLHTFLKERLPEPDRACICYNAPCLLTTTLSFISAMGEIITFSTITMKYSGVRALHKQTARYYLHCINSATQTERQGSVSKVMC